MARDGLPPSPPSVPAVAMPVAHLLMSSAELRRTPPRRARNLGVWQVGWSSLVGLTVDVRPVSGLGAVPTEIAERKTDRSAQDGRQDLLWAAV